MRVILKGVEKWLKRKPLERRRNTPFNCPKTNKSWIWSGATANKIDAHSVPQEMIG